MRAEGGSARVLVRRQSSPRTQCSIISEALAAPPVRASRRCYASRPFIAVRNHDRNSANRVRRFGATYAGRADFVDGACLSIVHQRGRGRERGDGIDRSRLPVAHGRGCECAGGCRSRNLGPRAHRPRSGRHHGDATRRTQLRRCCGRRSDRCGHHPDRPTDGQYFRDAFSHPGTGIAQPSELRAGPADFVAWVRGARSVRRPRRALVSGRNPGNDARRAGADRQLQPVVGGIDRDPARSVLDAIRQCRRRRDQRDHRGRQATSVDDLECGRRQLRHRRRGREGEWTRRRSRIRRRREPTRYGRVSRSFFGAPRSVECQSDRGKRSHADHDDRKRAGPTGDRGSARTDPRAVGIEPATGRSGRDPVRHAEDDSPAAGRTQR